MHNNKITTDIALALAELQAGNLVAFPTETVYGLGALATNITAIEKVFATKGRPQNHPLIVHIGSKDLLARFARDIPNAAYKLADTFWPGPLTLILRKQEHVLPIITGNQDTVAIRIPNHPITLKMLQQLGNGIVGPSANKYGRVSPTSAKHVAEDLHDNEILILDGGAAIVGIESTILDLTSTPTIRRHGHISVVQIENVLQTHIQVDLTFNPNASVSGTHLAHYAPNTTVVLVPPAELQDYIQQLNHHQFSVLSWQEPSINNVYWQQAFDNPEDYARELYANLRHHDSLQNSLIIVEMPPLDIAWAAIVDRLKRASSKSK